MAPRVELALQTVTASTVAATHSTAVYEYDADWRDGLPVLRGNGLTLRELRMDDAPALFTLLTSEEVTRFISPPPSTLQGFERFIEWTEEERRAGQYACFAVVPDGYNAAVGIFQVRQLEPSFQTAEWGFALNSAFWGSGLFVRGSELVIDFAFDVIGVHRLEARSAVENERGNGALRKLGAVKEAILRKSFLRGGKYLDQALWSIVSDDWFRSKAVWGAKAS